VVVSLTQIADLLGVTRQRAAQIVEDYADFPEPVVVLAGRRGWDEEAVEAWIATHPDRRPGRPRKRKTDTKEKNHK
jgi:predicted DNA-binding transcriptional regulator AlpA